MPLPITSISTAIGNLQRDYLFRMQVESLPRTLMGDFRNYLNGLMMDVYLTKGIFPNRKTDPITLFWGGQSFHHSGRDGSTKTGDLTFRLPEDTGILRFFNRCKDLTGNEHNHSAAGKADQVLTFGVYLLNSKKERVTAYRRLENVLVLGVDNVSLDKEGNNIITFSVNISWDRGISDSALVGKVLSNVLNSSDGSLSGLSDATASVGAGLAAGL